MVKLKHASLDDVCLLVTDGTHDTPKRVKEGFPLIKAKEIFGGKIDFESCDQISEQEHLRVIARSKPEYGDTLFTHIGASLGQSAFVKTHRPFSIKNIALFKPNPKIVDKRYLYYLVISPAFQCLAKQTKTGSAQPFLGLGDLRCHRITYHEELNEQYKIAAILFNYDELVENNTRRIKILEEMAQSIYREWFINYRFPGHEKVKMVDSPLGRIPEGWEVKGLGDCYEATDYVANGSFAALRENVTYCNAPDFSILVRTKDFNSSWNGDYVYVTEPSYRFLKKSSLNPGDIVVGNVGNVGMTFRLPDLGQPMTLGPNAITVKAKGNKSYIFHYLKSDIGQHLIHGIVSGSAQPKFNKTEFRKLPLPLPPTPLLSEYETICESFWFLGENLRKKNTNLRQTRDLLLQRLISGEIDVTDLDIQISED